MNYIELLKHIKSAAMNTKMVHSTFDGDVYANWNNESVSYGSVNVGLESIERSSNTVTYNVVLYYGDRLLQDKSNVNEIWIDGINTLQSIINSLPEEVSYETPITFTPFEQKFADYLAGQYVRVGLECEFDLGNCSIEVIEEEKKYITITENGEYNITGYDVATVNVQGGSEPVLEELNVTENKIYTPEEGVDGFNKVTVNVPVPTIQPSKTNNNLFSTTTPDTGYDAMSSVTNYETVNPTYLAVPAGYTLLDYLVAKGAGDDGAALSEGSYCDIQSTADYPLQYVGIVFKRVIGTGTKFNYLITNIAPNATTSTTIRTKLFTYFASSYRRISCYLGGSTTVATRTTTVALDGSLISVNMSGTGYSTNISTESENKLDSTVQTYVANYNSVWRFFGTSAAASSTVNQVSAIDTTFYGAAIGNGKYSLKFLVLPMKRNEDDVVGMYDLVNNAFYPSLGVPFEAGTVAAVQSIPIYELDNNNKAYKVDDLSFTTQNSDFLSFIDLDSYDRSIRLNKGNFLFTDKDKMYIISVK